MKQLTYYIICGICLLLASCAAPSQEAKSSGNNNSSASDDETELIFRKDGLPKAEKGITIVSKDGWTNDQMDFQQRYCESMFEQLDGYNAIAFCECFLSKVQYYYEPIYVREAYDDQKKWNAYCLNESLE